MVITITLVFASTLTKSAVSSYLNVDYNAERSEVPTWSARETFWLTIQNKYTGYTATVKVQCMDITI